MKSTTKQWTLSITTVEKNEQHSSAELFSSIVKVVPRPLCSVVYSTVLCDLSLLILSQN